jgi:hypothetical protein
MSQRGVTVVSSSGSPTIVRVNEVMYRLLKIKP